MFSTAIAISLITVYIPYILGKCIFSVFIKLLIRKVLKNVKITNKIGCSC